MATQNTVVNKSYDEIKAELTAQIRAEVNEDVAEQVKEAMERHKAEEAKKSQAQRKADRLNDLRRSIYGGGADRTKEAAKAAPLVEFMLCLRAASIQDRAPQDIAKASGFGQEVCDELATKSLSASSFSGGGALIPQAFATEFIEALYSRTLVRMMGARTVEMPQGRLDFGKMTGSALMYWIAEGNTIEVSSQEFGTVNLSAKKLAGLIPISNDLLRRETMPRGIDVIIEDDLLARAARYEDAAFIRGDGSRGAPKGVRNLINASNVFDAAAPTGATIQQINTDLHKAMFKVANADMPGLQQGWMMSTREFIYLSSLMSAEGFRIYPELQQGQLLGFAAGHTTAIPINLDRSGTPDGSEIYFGDFGQCIIGETEKVLIDSSVDASFVDADGNTVHGFASDRTMTRLIHEVDFGLRYNTAFSVIKNSWGNSFSA